MMDPRMIIEDPKDRERYEEALRLIEAEDYQAAAEMLNVTKSIDGYDTDIRIPDARRLASKFRKSLFGKWTYDSDY